jgi:hypothetical protein
MSDKIWEEDTAEEEESVSSSSSGVLFPPLKERRAWLNRDGRVVRVPSGDSVSGDDANQAEISFPFAENEERTDWKMVDMVAYSSPC